MNPSAYPPTRPAVPFEVQALASRARPRLFALTALGLLLTAFMAQSASAVDETVQRYKVTGNSLYGNLFSSGDCSQVNIEIFGSDSLEKTSLDGTVTETKSKLINVTIRGTDYCHASSWSLSASWADGIGLSLPQSLANAALATQRPVDVERCESLDGVVSCETHSEQLKLNLAWMPTEDFSDNVSSYIQSYGGLYIRTRSKGRSREATVQGVLNVDGVNLPISSGFGRLNYTQSGTLTIGLSQEPTP
jgi:hypothetical protein